MTYKIKEVKNGFTLIEIIASITIVGILIMFLLPAFPKVMTGSSDTEDKMVTGNLLTRVVEDVQKSEELKQYISRYTFNTNSDCKDPSKANIIPESDIPSIKSYQVDGRDFKVKISICQTEEEKKIDIIRTKIKITSPEDKESSETYTYIDQ